jgi:hypothetical protein
MCYYVPEVPHIYICGDQKPTRFFERTKFSFFGTFRT